MVGTQVHQDYVWSITYSSLIQSLKSFQSVYTVPGIALSSLNGVMDKKHRGPELVEFVLTY